MGIIVCQECQQIIKYYEDEKVTKLYSKCCPNCKEESK